MTGPRQAPSRPVHPGAKARLPWLTAALALAALALHAAPGLAGVLELDARLGLHEPWRLAAAHLLHFTGAHLAWDVGVLVGLGCIVERRWPARTRALVPLAMLAISAAFLAWPGGLATYRGLSGVDSALLLLLAGRMHSERALAGVARALPLATAAVFLAKVAHEALTGATWFVDPSGAFVPVPLAHLVGGALGLGFGLWPAQRAAGSSASAASRTALTPARIAGKCSSARMFAASEGELAGSGCTSQKSPSTRPVAIAARASSGAS